MDNNSEIIIYQNKEGDIKITKKENRMKKMAK